MKPRHASGKGVIGTMRCHEIRVGRVVGTCERWVTKRARVLGHIGKLLLVGVLCVIFASTTLLADEVRIPRVYKEYFTVKPPGSMDYRISDDPYIVTSQVRFAIVRYLSAIQLLSESGTPESLAATREVVNDGYALLRTATQGIDLAMRRSESRAPLLKLYLEKIWEVRWQLVTCMAELERAQGGDESKIDSATEILTWAVDRLTALLSTMRW